MMARIRATIAGIICAAVTVGALPSATQAAETETGELTVSADYACFRIPGETGLTEVEFTFMLRRHQFTFFPQPDGDLMAEVGIWLQLLDPNGVAVSDTIARYFGCTVQDTAEAGRPDYKVFYAMSLELPPGDYQAKVIALDVYSPGDGRRYGELTMPIDVRDMSSSDLLLSDLKLAFDINILEQDAPEAQGDVLVRNYRKVYPDPRGILSPNRPKLYFYGEVYNLAFEPGGENFYDLELRFLTPEGTTVKDFGRAAYRKPGTSAVLATHLDVKDLPQDNYVLELEVIDSVAQSRAVVRKPFQVRLMGDECEELTPEEAKRMRDVILYIARHEELKTYDELSGCGKWNFLREFWKRRDPTPGTPYNEFKDQHFQRINHANERFSTKLGDKTDGWMTDRGRIYIRYGEPDEIERYPSSLERKPLQQWYYYQMPDQGEIFFLFEDEDGFGTYNLVHSTARGEKYDPNWERIIEENRLIR